MPLTPGRIFLELFAENEAVHLMAALLHDSVYEEIRRCAPRAVAESEDQVEAFRTGTLPGDQLHWAIRDQLTHECLGSLQATLGADGSIAVGYRVRSACQNVGIATEALSLLLKELTSRLPSAPISASVHPRNGASIRVLTKSGFVLASQLSGRVSVNVGSELQFKYIPPPTSAA